MISVNLNRQSNRFLHGPPPETMFLPTLKEQDMKKLLAIAIIALSLSAQTGRPQQQTTEIICKMPEPGSIPKTTHAR